MNSMSRKLWVLGGLGLVLGACAAQAPLQQYSLGVSKAGYRDYAASKANICAVESREVAEELGDMNDLLTAFLSSTEKASLPTSVDYNRHSADLKEAAGSLGKVLDVHQANLQATRACDFAKSGALPELLERGDGLVRQSRERLALGTWLKDVQKAQGAWQEGAPQREQTARQTWCAKDPEVGNAEVFYARQYADGRIEWFFCDGHVLQSATAGGEPTLTTPEKLSAKDRRKVKPPRYIDAAQAYPAKEFDKQPTSMPTAAPTPPPGS